MVLDCKDDYVCWSLEISHISHGDNTFLITVFAYWEVSCLKNLCALNNFLENSTQSTLFFL